MIPIKRKRDILNKKLKGFGRVLLAYSGGVDSTFLLATARKALGRENVLAVTAVSETYPLSEKKQAERMASLLDVRHVFIETAELRDGRFRKNPVNRCFYCKDELFRKLSAFAGKENMALCDATNYSDRGDYRPGRKAARKWRVASPLEASRLTKDEVRALSRGMKLPTWDQPAQACLASRFPYGAALSKEELRRVERGEEYLKRFNLGTVRLRHHGDTARLEVLRERIPVLLKPANAGMIARYLKKLGWRYVTVDIEGYRTGSLNPSKPPAERRAGN
ncbi:MAG: ATP-dependent sacrificial sulfur transferase LarE [Endomicrobiales bacterium]